MAGAFGGLLASAIGKMNGVGGIRGWRWVFILGKLTQVVYLMYLAAMIYPLLTLTEGALGCVLAVLCYFAVPNSPDNARWLSPDDKADLKEKLLEDTGLPYDDGRPTVKRVLNFYTDCTLSRFNPIIDAYCRFHRQGHFVGCHVFWDCGDSI